MFSDIVIIYWDTLFVKLLNQDFEKEKLQQNFYGKHHELFDADGISVFQLYADMFPQ